MVLEIYVSLYFIYVAVVFSFSLLNEFGDLTLKWGAPVCMFVFVKKCKP